MRGGHHLKEIYVLQFQGTAETLTALLLKRDVYVRTFNAWDQLHGTGHTRRRGWRAHSAKVQIARSLEH